MYRFSREPFGKRPSFDPVVNKLSYVVQKVQQSYWDMPRDRLRRHVLGLRPKKRGGFYTNSRGEPMTTLHAYSPTISPAPGDWAETNIITGFWRLEDTEGWTPPADFQAFLSKGEQPIYLGFGSMSWGAQRNGEIIAKALTAMGRARRDRQGLGRGQVGDAARQRVRHRPGAAFETVRDGEGGGASRRRGHDPHRALCGPAELCGAAVLRPALLGTAAL